MMGSVERGKVLDDLVTFMEEFVAESRQEVDQYKGKLEAMNSSKLKLEQGLRAELEETRKKLEACKKYRELVTERMEELEAQVKQKEASVQSLQDTVSMQKKVNDESEVKRQRLEGELKVYQQKIGEMGGDLDKWIIALEGEIVQEREQKGDLTVFQRKLKQFGELCLSVVRKCDEQNRFQKKRERMERNLGLVLNGGGGSLDSTSALNMEVTEENGQGTVEQGEGMDSTGTTSATGLLGGEAGSATGSSESLTISESHQQDGPRDLRGLCRRRKREAVQAPASMCPELDLGPSSPGHGIDNGKDGFHCVCGVSYKSSGQLKDHCTFFAAGRTYSCAVCKESYPYTSLRTLYNHMKLEHKTKTYPGGSRHCKACGVTFETMQEYKEHLEDFTSTGLMFVCPVNSKLQTEGPGASKRLKTK